MVRQSAPAQTTTAKRPLDTTEIQYSKLRQHLIDGRFPPGSMLLETTLSTQYGVSRTPMREALGRLAQDGMIERLARGFRVRARTPEEIIDIYDARIALESTCAGLAAVRHTDFDMVRLSHLVEERRRATDAHTFAKLNNSWHDALRSAGHNPTITELLARLDVLLEIYRSKSKQPGADRSVGDHDAILGAIRDRDADAAEILMREHLRHMRDRRIANLLEAGG
jgi:DNA-binding GntR family transcriptional regulator